MVRTRVNKTLRPPPTTLHATQAGAIATSRYGKIANRSEKALHLELRSEAAYEIIDVGLGRCHAVFLGSSNKLPGQANAPYAPTTFVYATISTVVMSTIQPAF